MSRIVPKIYRVEKIEYNSGTKSFKTNDYGGEFYITDSINLDFVKNMLKGKPRTDRLEENKTIYVGRNSKVPRAKLKEFIYSNKFRKTKNPSSAKVIIVNKKETSTLIHNLSENKKQYYFFPRTDELIHELTLLGLDVKENVDGYICGAYNPLKNKVRSLNKVNVKDFIVISNYGSGQVKDQFENLFEIAYNKDCEIVYDEDILEQLNEEGVVVNEDFFKNLRSMLSSPDADNITVAMEIMANSNYKESYLQLAMLLTDYWSEVNIYRKTWNQNFKGMLMYIENQGLEVTGGWRLFSSMVKKTHLNKETESIITEYIKHNIQEENDHIKIKSIEIEF